MEAESVKAEINGKNKNKLQLKFTKLYAVEYLPPLHVEARTQWMQSRSLEPYFM